MKKILFSMLLYFTFSNMNAQITKGNWLIGGDIAFSYSKSKPESTVDFKTYNINLSPNVGYFFWNNLALGLRTDFTHSYSKTDSGTSKFDRFLLSPFAKYYFLNVDNTVNPFIESSYRFSLINENHSKEFSAKGGIAVFLNGSVALEIFLNYLNSITNNSFIGSQTVLLGIGLQVHLEKL